MAKLYKELIKKCDSFVRVAELDFQGPDPSGWPGHPQGGQSNLQCYGFAFVNSAGARGYTKCIQHFDDKIGGFRDLNGVGVKAT